MSEEKPWRTRLWHFIVKRPLVTAIVGILSFVVTTIATSVTIVASKHHK